MGYYMRFVKTDDRPLTVKSLAAALAEEDSGYELLDSSGILSYCGEPCAQLDINCPGDGLFTSEIAAMVQDVEETKGQGQKRVLETLKSAKAVVTVQVLFQGRDTEAAMELIDPIWLWLFREHEGLVQADDEGYYTRSRRILAME